MLHYCNKHLFQLMASILLILAISSCNSKNEEIDSTDYNKVADHTVLMYLNGDNTLTNAIETNYKDAKTAILDSLEVGAINLVVFKDNYYSDKLPELFWIHRNAKNSLDTIPLITFTEQVDATSVEVFTKVLSTTFTKFNSSIKGLIFGGHALGWAPSDTYSSKNASIRRAPTYIGIDETTGTGVKGYMEIPELRQAIASSNVKFDYILFDACNMGNLECAYEIKDYTRYMVAAPTEIEGYGFPYRNVISRLATCKSSSDLPKSLKYCITCYYNTYKKGNGATISLFDLSKLDKLAQAYRNAWQSQEGQQTNEAINNMTDNEKYNWQYDIQYYGRMSVKSRFYFYDILSVIDICAPASSNEIKAALNDVVLCHLYTDVYHEIPIDHCCGMSVALPQLFAMQKGNVFREFFQQTYDNLWDLYRKLQWNQLMGY